MAGHPIGDKAHASVARLAIALAFLVLAARANVLAQVGGGSPSILPHATITSGETSAGSSEPAVDEDVPPAVAPSPAAPHSHPRHHASVPESLHTAAPDTSYSPAVEPAHAMLKLNEDAWAHAGPANSSHTLERVHAGKFVNVTGSTHYYLQVKLKDGATGYIPISAVELTRPEDKVMRLSTDAGVLSQPNRYGKRLSQVHQGHDVHVIGISMNFMKIRMKSGLEGYIPLTAAQ